MAEGFTPKTLDITLHDRVPDGHWCIVDVTFPATAHTDYQIPHTLSPNTYEQVEYTVLRQSTAGTVYEDRSASRAAWQQGFIILRSDTPGWTGRLLLRVLKTPKPYSATVAAATSVAFSGDLILLPTKKLYFDGGVHTYISETSANVLQAYVGGSLSMTWGAASVQIPATNKLYLDSGGDTYIVESSANVLQAYVGGSLSMTWGAASVQIPATNKLYLDSGGDTWIDENSSNNLRLVAGGVAQLQATPTVVTISGQLIISAGNSLYLDGGGDTLIYESAANVLTFYVGGTNVLSLTATLVSSSQDVALAATKKLYLDGGSNTYLLEPVADAVQLYVGGNLAVGVGSDGMAIQATKKFYLDGGGNTYIYESSADALELVAGARRVQMGTAYFSPYTDNVMSCGGPSSSNRWTAVWAVNGTIQSSDRSLKRGIRKSDLGTAFLTALRPVRFEMQDEPGQSRYGFVAQEVIAALGARPALGLVAGESGGYGINYSAFVVPLVTGWQDHERRLRLLEGV